MRQDAVEDRAPDPTLLAVASKAMDERHAEAIDVVAQRCEDGRQHGQRADHRDGDDDHGRHSERREGVAGEEHARHRDDDGRP